MIPSNSVQLVFVGGCFRRFVVAVVGTYLVDLGYSNEALPVLLEISSTNYVSFKSFNVLLLLHISPPSATDRHLYPEPCESIGCNSHTDTDHRQLRIGTTLSRAVTSAL